jgi:RNA polymerase sigma-70 factor, ECF subfamily
MDRTEEKTLIRGLVKMDDRAWERLCEEYSPPLKVFVRYRFGFDQQKVEEVVQRVFVRCVRSIRTFDASRGRLLNWLKTIAMNETRSLCQEEARQPAGGMPAACFGAGMDGVLEKIDSQPLPDEILARLDVQTLIHETIAELYSRYRKVLVLKYLENRKVAEIAEKLNQSENAVESLLTRSREAFRRTFLEKAREHRITESEALL